MGVAQWPEFSSDTPWPPFDISQISNSGLKQLAGNASWLIATLYQLAQVRVIIGPDQPDEGDSMIMIIYIYIIDINIIIFYMYT